MDGALNVIGWTLIGVGVLCGCALSGMAAWVLGVAFGVLEDRWPDDIEEAGPTRPEPEEEPKEPKEPEEPDAVAEPVAEPEAPLPPAAPAATVSRRAPWPPAVGSREVVRRWPSIDGGTGWSEDVTGAVEAIVGGMALVRVDCRIIERSLVLAFDRRGLCRRMLPAGADGWRELRGERYAVLPRWYRVGR